MTELTAFTLRRPSRPKAIPIRNRSSGAGDAWSVVHYPDRASQIVKEVGSHREESCLEHYLDLNPHAEGRTFVFTASRSRNRRLPMNVGPFERHIGGRCYSISLQGMPAGLENGGSDTGAFQPVGDSHQEAAACRIFSAIARRGIDEWGDEDYSWLRSHLRTASKRQAFNAVLSDGDSIACYHAGDGSPLSFRKLEPGRSLYECEMLRIDWGRSQVPRGGFVVSTAADKIGGDWQPFDAGEMVVFRRGEILYFDSDR